MITFEKWLEKNLSSLDEKEVSAAYHLMKRAFDAGVDLGYEEGHAEAQYEEQMAQRERSFRGY